MLNVSVVGFGHLAEATRECCSKHFTMTEIWNADLVWFCVDTPVNENDESDMEFVKMMMDGALRVTKPTSPFLISSQVPVGTCAEMEAEFPDHHLAVQPENIRKAHAVEDFANQPRMICGTRHDEDHVRIRHALGAFTDLVYFMSPESAEMCKHALNSFLALEITFANEIADLCETVGANTDDVIFGFRADHRVGNGPLDPGGPYTGGTLGRDVVVLNQHNPGPVISAIKPSNDLRLNK